MVIGVVTGGIFSRTVLTHYDGPAAPRHRMDVALPHSHQSGGFGGGRFGQCLTTNCRPSRYAYPGEGPNLAR